jgi:hypothetical protein
MEEDEDIERFVIELTLELQANMFADLAAGFALTDRNTAAEMIRSIEQQIAHGLKARANEFRERGLSTDGIRQVAGFLADTFSEAKQKMAQVAKPVTQQSNSFQ